MRSPALPDRRAFSGGAFFNYAPLFGVATVERGATERPGGAGMERRRGAYSWLLRAGYRRSRLDVDQRNRFIEEFVAQTGIEVSGAQLDIFPGGTGRHGGTDGVGPGFPDLASRLLFAPLACRRHFLRKLC